MNETNNLYHIRIGRAGKLIVLIAVMLLFILTAWNYKGMYKPNAKSSAVEDKKTSFCFPELYYAAEGKIYYISLVDNCIYELNTGDGIRRLICGNRANEIGLIYEKGWIYYVSLENFSLNRVNINTKETEEISDNLLCSSENFLKYNDSLYYFDDSGNIHLIYQNGSSDAVDDKIKTAFLSGIKRYTKISSQWIYTWDMFSIYKTSIEGGVWEKVIDNIYPLYEVYNGWIYYVDNTDFKLYKINEKTMEKETVCSQRVIQQGADFDGGNMVLDGDNLYYTSFSDNEKAELYRINLKNGSKSIISDMAVYFIIHNGYVYYMDDFNSGKLYEKKLKNSSKRILTSGSLMPYIGVKDEILIYALKSADGDDSEDGRLFAIYMDKNLIVELK